MNAAQGRDGRSRLPLVLGSVGVALAIVAAAAYGVVANRSRTENLDVSWAESYHSVKELKAHADIAVAGTITSVVSHTTNDKGLQFTDFGLAVTRVIYDPRRRITPGGRVRVHQTGGVQGKVTQQVADDPLFRIGESAVLFLKEYNPGYYRVIGGPTGRFRLTNGAVRPINNEGLQFSGTLDALAREVAVA